MINIICESINQSIGIVYTNSQKKMIEYNCNDDGYGGCGCVLHTGEYTCNDDGNGGCACVVAGY